MDGDASQSAGDFLFRVRPLNRHDLKITKSGSMEDQVRLAGKGHQSPRKRIVRRKRLQPNPCRRSERAAFASEADHIVAALLKRSTEYRADLTRCEIRQSAYTIHGLVCWPACHNSQRARGESWRIFQSSVSGGNDEFP